MCTVPDLSNAGWVKSSYSNGNGGGCVEWAPGAVADMDAVPVRDSKLPGGPALLFGREAFTAFVRTVKGSGTGR